jgi:hypothetical protein
MTTGHTVKYEVWSAMTGVTAFLSNKGVFDTREQAVAEINRLSAAQVSEKIYYRLSLRFTR